MTGCRAACPFPSPRPQRSNCRGKKYLTLTKLVELKLASGMSAPDRPRDLDDVIQLIRKNRLGEHFADALHPYVQDKYREMWRYAQRPSDLPE